MKPAALALLASSAFIRGQASFETASIRIDTSYQPGSIVRTPGGIRVTNTGLGWFLEMAYQTKQVDWSHVPDSLRAQRYDILGKASGRLTGDQYWELCRNLLEDRFKLKFHREVKPSPVYALVLRNPDSSGTGAGPKLVRSKDEDCPVNPTDLNFCGVQGGFGTMLGQRVSMARIARELSTFAGRPVQDRTGLTGAFDFELKWTPDTLEPLSDGDGAKLNGASASGPSFSTAVERQLGLTLKPEKGQIDVLVIDHLEKPSEN